MVDNTQYYADSAASSQQNSVFDDTHFVLANHKKEPIDPNTGKGYSWPKRAFSLTEATRWAKMGHGKPGLIPASMGLAVIDVDNGGRLGCDYLIEHLGLSMGHYTILNSNREKDHKNGFHIYVRVDKNFSRYSFKLNNGKVSGEVLGDSCYAVIHPNFSMWCQAITDLVDTGMVYGGEHLKMKLTGKSGGKKGGKKRSRQEPEYIDEILLKMITCEEGERNDVLYESAESLLKILRNPWVLKAICLKMHQDMPESELDDTINSAIKNHLDRYGDKGGIVETTYEGFTEAVRRLDYETRYDVLKNCLQLKHPEKTRDKWTAITDKLESGFRVDLSSHFWRHISSVNDITQPYRLPRELWNDYLWNHSPLVNSLNEDYLKKIGPWDGVERLEYYLLDCFQILTKTQEEWNEDGRLNLIMEMSRLLILALTARNTQDVTSEIGVKFDLCLLITGREGVGKSTFCKYLLPPSLGVYEGGFCLSADSKTQAESIQGKCIVEFAEMSGLKRAEVQRYLAFLSMDVEPQIRRAYAKFPESSLRFACFVGTSNSQELIPHQAGSGQYRRWVVFEANDTCNPKFVRDYLNDYRDQLFAEALHTLSEYRANNEGREMPLILSPEAEEVQAKENAKYTNIDPELLSDVHKALMKEYPNGFKTSDIIAEMGRSKDITNFEKGHVISIIKTQGYQLRPKRTDGSVEKVWLK